MGASEEGRDSSFKSGQGGRTLAEEELASRLLGILERHSRELFSGAVLLLREGRELLAEARGFAHRGFGVPNALETRFDTASLAKLFTAAAAFRLVDRGLLGLDERVRDIVELPGGSRIPRDVSLRHCLSHSSGIADDADEEAGEDYEAIWRELPCYRVRETADFLPQFAFKEPLFRAGERSRYNNCAFILVGLALEARSGLSFRKLVEEEVFRPAGMASSGYFAKDGIEPGLAEGYAGEGGPEGGFRKNIYSYPPIGSPDAGAYVTVRDLRRFFEALEGPSFLSPASRAEFLSPVIDAFAIKDGGLRRYGYALEHDFDLQGRRFRYGKDGVNPGVAAIAMRYPGTEGGKGEGFIAILANQDAEVWSLCRELAAAAGLYPPDRT